MKIKSVFPFCTRDDIRLDDACPVCNDTKEIELDTDEPLIFIKGRGWSASYDVSTATFTKVAIAPRAIYRVYIALNGLGDWQINDKDEIPFEIYTDSMKKARGAAQMLADKFNKLKRQKMVLRWQKFPRDSSHTRVICKSEDYQLLIQYLPKDN